MIKSSNIQHQDLVGDEIREKIKEIGLLWHKSENNPKVSKEVLRCWDILIEEWVSDKDMPLIVRKDTAKRGQAFMHPTGREIIISDNSVAIWVYSNVLKNMVFTLSQIKNMLLNNELPMVFMQTKEIKANAKYSKAMGADSLRGWKVCHIDSVGFNTSKKLLDIDIDIIKDHFRRYANPNNMFILPKEIGYLGEVNVFIECQKQ